MLILDILMKKNKGEFLSNDSLNVSTDEKDVNPT